jgi:attachment p12 family protein
MTLQTIVVLVIVAGAFAYLASRNLRMFRGKSGGCGGGCGCSKSKASQENPVSVNVPLQQLSLRDKSS